MPLLYSQRLTLEMLAGAGGSMHRTVMLARGASPVGLTMLMTKGYVIESTHDNAVRYSITEDGRTALEGPP